MIESLNANQVVNNIVSGIAAGVAVAIILGLYHVATAYCQRKYQINYVSEMIADGIHRIHDESNNQTQLLYYNRMLRELDMFLSSDASSKIKFSEKQTLRTTLPYRITGNVMFMVKPPSQADKFFDDAIEQFQGVEWLILEK